MQKLGDQEGSIKDLLRQFSDNEVLRYRDQDISNLLCINGNFPKKGGWFELPYNWNFQGLGSYAEFRVHPSDDKPGLFSASELHEMASNPSIVHFTGPAIVKPTAFLNTWVMAFETVHLK